MKIFILLILFVPFRSFSQIYVSPSGFDTNQGTQISPFKTISKAASVAQSGQTVYIAQGVYRETITPVNNGVTFRNADNGVALISGLNLITTPWVAHGGSIYRTSITLPVNGFGSTLTSNTTLLANQIFKDGVMMLQARWPNMSTPEDLIDRTKYRHHSQTQGLGRTSVTDNGLPAGNFTNASIWVTGWFISETKTITSHTNKTLNYAALNENGKFQKWYYIINDLELLDSPKEWHYENGTLYFWQEGGGVPTNVEYKARNWGFDLRGKSNTKIIGLHFIGCEPATGDTGTNGTVIDGIRASYTNHAFVTSTNDHNYFNAKQTGIKLLGSNNIIKNSEFRHVSSQVIWASSGTVVENNLCYNIGWEGNYGAFVGYWGTNSDGSKVQRNTAYRLGRSAVDFGHGTHKNNDIGYNHFYQFSMVTSDVGATYGCCGVQIPGTRIHHNWIHDNTVMDGWKTAANYDGIHVNIYFDQGAGPATVDHNVLWNGSVADAYSEIKNGVLTNWYNNTFASSGSLGERESYFCPHDTPNDPFRNNIFQHVVNINWKPAVNNDNASQPGDVANSVFKTTDPQFVGTGEYGLKYQLRPTSPAINAGTVISGITDGSKGAPDAGAYEYDVPAWTAGYKSVTPDPIPPDPEEPDPEPPVPPRPELTDTTIVNTVSLKKAYRTVTTSTVMKYDTIPPAIKIEAETGDLTLAQVNGKKVCCIQPNAVLKYGTITSRGKIKITFARGNTGLGKLIFRFAGKDTELSFEQTASGTWDTFREKEFTIPEGVGVFELRSSMAGAADLDNYIIP